MSERRNVIPIAETARSPIVSGSAAPDISSPTLYAVDDWPDDAEFWRARRSLTHLHTFARARLVAPWSAFGSVLTRIVTATSPQVQLPPLVGSCASLNLFVGLVGPSGSGKDAAQRVGRDALDLGDAGHFTVAPLGSGEGLTHMFMRDTREGPEQYNQATLVTIGEIDTLSALVKRQSSTVMSQLRQAAMGEQLGFFYADKTKRMIVPEHQYRLCLVAGIQPRRSAVLLEDADGGTPQRFVWLPSTDPQAPDHEPPEPAPMVWQAPEWASVRTETHGGYARRLITLPPEAVETVKQARRDRNRGRGDALDGHALLTRLKVAAALAILEGRHMVDDEDWHLSGIVMAVSDATRAQCTRALQVEGRERNRAAAVAEAERVVVVKQRVNEADTRRVAQAIKRKLSAAGSDGLTRGKLRGALAGPDRPHFDAAIEALTVAGDVIEDPIEYQGQAGQRYRLANHG